MKFAHKIAFVMVGFFAVLLSVTGFIITKSTFDASLASEVDKNYTQHVMERYSLEYDFRAADQSYTVVTESHVAEFGQTLVGYVGVDKRWIILYGEDRNLIFSNGPVALFSSLGTDEIFQEKPGYYLSQFGDMYVMYCSSTVHHNNGDVWLLSVFDISEIYSSRDAQVRTIILVDGIGLLIAAVFVLAFSYGVTQPLRRLSRASRKIAGGSYSTRSAINSNDEIGQLSENFDKMATAVEQHIAELNLTVKQREDFVAAFTHEIKTPMTAIIGYADRLRLRSTQLEQTQKASSIIYKEAARLESLSQKLLQLMSLSLKPIEPGKTELRRLLYDSYTSVISELGDIQLQIMPAGPDLFVSADADLIIDLLRNLLLNAIRAEPKDGIILGYRLEDNRCMLYVQDSGRGIPKEELEHIVEPFYMVDKSRARRGGGSGVGLALCHKIAECHGTAIRFDSREGEGTVVSFFLPIYN